MAQFNKKMNEVVRLGFEVRNILEKHKIDGEKLDPLQEDLVDLFFFNQNDSKMMDDAEEG